MKLSSATIGQLDVADGIAIESMLDTDYRCTLTKRIHNAGTVKEAVYIHASISSISKDKTIMDAVFLPNEFKKFLAIQCEFVNLIGDTAEKADALKLEEGSRRISVS